MSGRTRLLAAIVGGLAVIALIAGVAITLQRGQDEQPSGQPGPWPAQERTAFIDSCVKSCRAAPGVTPARYPLCDQACKCGADEAEKIVTGQELVEIYKAMQSGKPTKEQSDKLERMKAAGVACVGQGARP
jgi:hypothetical protein